ncbi:MAG: bifunctional methylenetetrahydrofolate dehydrogenase/methenyltetrahydrofolate cyclohydrolase, partial [Thermoleophilia bacterium]|nr:bifunctional methylenetetrahydrofolate dehydrogenase/methenyltetrahydrofolate cyclohydrolase [Thermoleophilia bacterium]
MTTCEGDETVTAAVIDGKAVAEELRAELIAELNELKGFGAAPGIATLQVGDDFGAGMYRAAVEKFCGEMGLGYRQEQLPADASEQDVIRVVEDLNQDP